MGRMYSVVFGTGKPKDRDEVNKWDSCEWDGWVCERDVIGAPSIFKLTHRAAALDKLLPIFALSCPRKAARLKWKVPRCDCAGWTPEAAKKRSVSRWACKNRRRANSLCNLADTLTIACRYCLLWIDKARAKDCCLLWIDKARAKDKTYIWVSVRWKTKKRIYTPRMHCVARQNKLETPKEKDEFNKREVHECDVRARDPDAMVVPPSSSPPTPKPTRF